MIKNNNKILLIKNKIILILINLNYKKHLQMKINFKKKMNQK